MHKKGQVRDWGDGSVSKVLAMQAGGPEFESQSPHFKKLNMVAHSCNSITRQVKTGGSWSLYG